MITLDKFFEFAVNEMHHWMRMSEISDHVSDKRYFSGRHSISDRFVYKATDYESIDQIVSDLDNYIINADNVYFRIGQLDEIRLLLKLITKNYKV